MFLLLAVALSWWAWPLALLDPTGTALVPVGPSLAAVIVAGLASSGRHDVAVLLRRLVRWRVPAVWWAVALLGPVTLIGAAVLADLALGATADPAVRFPGWAVLPLLLAVRILVSGPLGEELGWRGFPCPGSYPGVWGALGASLVIAPLWFAFHLPVFLAGPATAQRPPLLFLLWVVPLSVLHTWLYLRARCSVAVVIVFHGMIDTAASLLFPLFSGADYTRMWWLLVVLTTASAVAVVRLDPLFRR